MQHCLLLFIFVVFSAHSAEPIVLPEGGEEIGVDAALTSYISPENGKATKQPDQLLVEVNQKDSSKPYCAQVVLTCKGAHQLPANTPLLAVVKARVVDGAKAELIAKAQHGVAKYEAFTSTRAFEIFNDWREYPVLLTISEDHSSDRLQFVLMGGHQVQKFAIASIRLFRYPVGSDLETFPRIRRSYVGREPDAAWRKEALERIEKNRKGDFQHVILDPSGKPLINQEVTIELKRHEFGFGSAIPVARLLEQSPDGEQYRKVVDECFSMVVFENDLKDYSWQQNKNPEEKQKRNAKIDQAMAWLSERNISLRGHYLMQTARPNNLQGKPADQIRNHFIESAKERLDFVNDRVIEWDVINHPVAWGGADLLTKYKGLERIDREIFSLALERTKLPMIVNEDQIFRPGRQQDETYDYIVGLQKEKFPVAGLGNQAHFDESFLPSPVDMLAVTDRFAKIVPTQIITEYDVVTVADEQLAADFTRDSMIAYFSHSAYHGFILWGFWEGQHWKPQAASWNKDWSIRKRGEVFRDLVTIEWHTKVTVTTDATGQIKWRGFPGLYSVKQGDSVMSDLRVTLKK